MVSTLAERSRLAANVAFMTLFALRLCSAQLENITLDQLEKTTLNPNEIGRSEYGYPCSTNLDCDYSNSMCENILKICLCDPEFPATNYVRKCGKPAAMNEPCEFDEQCQYTLKMTKCSDNRCVCAYNLVVEMTEDGEFSCVDPYRVSVNKSKLKYRVAINKCLGHPNNDAFGLLLLFYLLLSVFINTL